MKILHQCGLAHNRYEVDDFIVSPPSNEDGGFFHLRYGRAPSPRPSTYDRINQELGMTVEVCFFLMTTVNSWMLFCMCIQCDALFQLLLFKGVIEIVVVCITIVIICFCVYMYEQFLRWSFVLLWYSRMHLLF